jgi:hypothetical protein
LVGLGDLWLAAIEVVRAAVGTTVGGGAARRWLGLEGVACWEEEVVAWSPWEEEVAAGRKTMVGCALSLSHDRSHGRGPYIKLDDETVTKIVVIAFFGGEGNSCNRFDFAKSTIISKLSSIT